MPAVYAYSADLTGDRSAGPGPPHRASLIWRGEPGLNAGMARRAAGKRADVLRPDRRCIGAMNGRMLVNQNSLRACIRELADS